MKTVLIQLPNAFCGEEIKVDLTVRSRKGTAQKKMSFLVDLADLFTISKESTTRTFYPQCKPLFGKAHLLCHKAGGEIFRPNQKGDDEPYEFSGNHVSATIEIEVEGLNGKLLEGTLVNKQGRQKVSMVPSKNRALLSFQYNYSCEEEEHTDRISLYIQTPQRYRDVVYDFNIKIKKNKQFTIEEVHASRKAVVVAYAVKIADNNFKPCKFTDLEIRELEPNSNFIKNLKDTFDELMQQTFDSFWHTLSDRKFENAATYFEADGFQKIVFTMIGNDQSKDVLIIVKDFTTLEKQCTTNPKHQEQIIIELDSRLTTFESSKLKFGVIKLKSGETKLNLSYPYAIINNLIPFHYFSPLHKPMIHRLIIASCRRTLNIPIKIYPDIQWFIGIKIEIGDGIEDTPKFRKMFSKEVFKTSKKKVANKLKGGMG
jgi:hypothetical protein